MIGATHVDRWSEKDSALYRYLLSPYEDYPADFIERVVTQDETWVKHFGPESKMHSKQGKHTGSLHLRNLRGFIQQVR